MQTGYSRANYVERLASFQHDITEIGPDTVFRLPDLTRYLNHDGENGQFPDLPAGMYVARSIQKRLRLDQSPQETRFKPDDSLKLTREDSRHQVFFGRIQFLGQSAVHQERVAVKAVKANLRELAMYQLMGDLGIQTFRPVGFIIQGTGNTHLMTKVNQAIKTIDSTDWALLEPDEMWFIASTALDTMVLIHSHMLFHGDLSFRNVATSDFGEPVVTDPEFMTSMRGVADRIVEADQQSGHPVDVKENDIRLQAIARKIGMDFTAVSTSIKSDIFQALPESCRPQTAQAAFKQLEHHLYRPYEAQLNESCGPYKNIALKAFGILHAIRRQQAKQGTV